jgi:hypothetical protein
MPRDVTTRIRQVAPKALTAPDLVKADLAKFAKVVEDANIPVQD